MEGYFVSNVMHLCALQVSISSDFIIYFLFMYVQGACIALNADKWLECLSKICAFNNLPPPTDDERLPVGTGSNPVSFNLCS